MANDPKDELGRSPSWWQSLPGMLTALAGVLSAAAALGVALHQLGVFDHAKAPTPTALPVAQASVPTNKVAGPTPDNAATIPAGDGAAAYRVTLPSGDSVTLSGNRGVATYKVLGVQARRRGPDTLTLKVSIRLTNAGPSDVGFWSDSFRLLIDGVPRAPTNWLNEDVDARSAKDADIEFEVPTASKSLALQISEGKESDTLPLRLEPR